MESCTYECAGTILQKSKNILINEGVNSMNTKFSKAFLMSGKDFKITDSIILHHPTIGDILSLDESADPDHTYWSYVQLLLADPYENMVMLDDLGKNYLDVTPFEVFCLQWDRLLAHAGQDENDNDLYKVTLIKSISNAINFFILGDHCFVKNIYENGDVYFYDINDTSCQINASIFGYLYEWVKSINKIDSSGRIKPADENARRVLIEDMRDEMKKKRRRKKNRQEENSDYFGSIMSAACFCGNGAINPFNINQCKLYWINENMSITGRKNHSDHVLDGIYHGTIRLKDINKNELDWLK